MDCARLGMMQDCRTALMNAAEKGHVEVVRVLLAMGADKEAVDQVRASVLFVTNGQCCWSVC